MLLFYKDRENESEDTYRHICSSLLCLCVPQCGNSHLKHQGLFLSCINLYVFVILRVFYPYGTVVVVVVVVVVVRGKLPPLSSSSSSVFICFPSGLMWFKAVLEDWGLGCYLPVIDASCKSHCPHSTGRQKERGLLPLKDGRMEEKETDNAGRLMAIPCNTETSNNMAFFMDAHY